jgi:hypothetical protein
MRLGVVKQAVLDFIDKRNAQLRSVSASPNARNYLPKLMANGQFKPKEIKDAMEALLDDGILRSGVKIGWTEARNPIVGLGRLAREAS